MHNDPVVLTVSIAPRTHNLSHCNCWGNGKTVQDGISNHRCQLQPISILCFLARCGSLSKELQGPQFWLWLYRCVDVTIPTYLTYFTHVLLGTVEVREMALKDLSHHGTGAGIPWGLWTALEGREKPLLTLLHVIFQSCMIFVEYEMGC